MLRQANIINYHIEEIKEHDLISERTKNVCLEDELDTLYKILLYYLEHRSFLTLKNCGHKTNQELIALAENYIQQYGITSDGLQLSPEERLFEKLKYHAYTQFSIKSNQLEAFRQPFFDHQFPLFQLINLIINTLYNEREQHIFNHNSGYMLNYERRTLQAIGDQFGITRERIRQIALQIPLKINEALNILSHELDFIKIFINYTLHERKDYYRIDEETAEEINQCEGMHFTPRFIAMVMDKLYRDHEGIILPDKEFRHYYLINNELTEQFSFADFILGITTLLEERIEQTYTLNIEEYLTRFYNKDHGENIRVSVLCRSILHDEFALEVDRNNLITLQRNTSKKLAEYIIEILTEAGEPLSLEKIAEKLNDRSNKIPQNIESLRSTILSIDAVLAIGKTSTYALTSWNNIKTGTIKALAEEFLQTKKQPQHISAITEYIQQYRNTTEKNILSNLKLDKSDTFIFFKKGFVGLTLSPYHKPNDEFILL